jgi:hypothetical protein
MWKNGNKSPDNSGNQGTKPRVGPTTSENVQAKVDQEDAISTKRHGPDGEHRFLPHRASRRLPRKPGVSRLDHRFTCLGKRSRKPTYRYESTYRNSARALTWFTTSSKGRWETKALISWTTLLRST